MIFKSFFFLFLILLFPVAHASNSGYASSSSYNVYIETPSEQASSFSYNVQVGQTSVAGYASSSSYNVYVGFDSIIPPPSIVGGVGGDCFYFPKSYSFNGRTFIVEDNLVELVAPTGSMLDLVFFFSATCSGGMVVSDNLSKILVQQGVTFSRDQEVFSFKLNAPPNAVSLRGFILLGNKKVDVLLRTVPNYLFRADGVFSLTADDFLLLARNILEYNVVCFGQFSHDCLYRFERVLAFGVADNTYRIYWFRVIDLLSSVSLGAVVFMVGKRQRNNLLIVYSGVVFLVWFLLWFV